MRFGWRTGVIVIKIKIIALVVIEIIVLDSITIIIVVGTVLSGGLGGGQDSL